jgi:iron-sulfur cluster repair protein YtfE (RIC family)
MSSTLGIFVNKLISFFEDLSETFPEEREIKLATEALHGVKKINPRLMFDMFVEYVKKPLQEHIMKEDEEKIIAFARAAIDSQFNEISPALMIFDKHWGTMSEKNQRAVWNHLKVLVILADKI